MKKEKTRDNTNTRDITPGTLQLLRQGNHDAYKEVYLHYADPVYHFLKLLMRSGEDAREITQEVFLQVWEKRAKINPAGSIKGYIYTIAKNTAMNFFEHRKVHEKYMSLTHHLQEENTETSEEIVIARETAILVEIAISRMPNQQRRVFLLSHDEGLSAEEIARQLNISKNTVDSHLFSAKKKIREYLS
jgi:RNA polymerase sigma-70 factor (ECF subfamily)